MTLRGSVFTANAGLPENDAVQVFVHMHIHSQTYSVGIAVMSISVN
jgi:hypothetical protein